MGDPEGILMFDETGFVKKGQDSVGVAQQYCGTLGKVENCQVGVFAGYASRHGYALVDKRLFLPAVWWTNAYTARRARRNVPEELTFQSKPQLAAAMLQAMAQEGLPARTVWLVIKRTFGADPVYSSAISNAPASTPLRTFVWLSGVRWAIEQCFEEGKTALGMAHYEVRKGQ